MAADEMRTTGWGLATGGALVLLAIALLLVAGSGPAYRLELLPLRAAFAVLRYGVYLACAAGGLGLILLAASLWRGLYRRALLGALVLVAAGTLASIPIIHWQWAQTVPPIHDITTDTAAPPAFEALANARRTAPNGLDYGGEVVARQQRQAYPDIAPLQLQASLDRVMAAARAEAQAFGWVLAAANDRTLEATATTPWFGFRDDIVIRLRQTGGGVRVDMRSASRLGRSDVGANAARIRAYLAALKRRLGAP